MRQAWTWSVLAAGVVHGLALVGVGPPLALRPLPPMQFRLMALESAPGFAPNSAQTDDAGDHRSTPPRLEEPVREAWSRPEDLQPLEQSTIDALERDGPSSAYSYLPRPLLSRGPEPISPIFLAWRDGDERQGRYQAVLALFIDEHGIVQSTRLEEGDLPPDMLGQARRAFSAARFWPGELDGRVVRTRLSVEIVFEQQRVDVRLHKGP